MRWEADVLKPALLMAVALTLGGCGTVSGWFSGGRTATKPAELVDFKPTATLARAWNASVGGAGPFVFSPGSDGSAVYVADRDGRVVKLDLANGRELWRVDAGRALSAGVGVGAGLALVGTPRGEVLAFRTTDGSLAWSTRLSGEILVPPVALEGMVAARANDGRIYLLDAATGQVRWQYSRALPALTLREQGHLALTPVALYAGHAGGRLTALTLNNGAPLWEANVALPRGATELERIADVAGPLALDGRMVCAAAFQGRVACFDRLTGNGIWARELSALRGLDIDARHVYAADERGAVLAFERARGTNPWKQDKLRDRRLSSPVAVAQAFVAVGDYQGHVHLLDAETGAFAARAATDGSAIQGVMLSLRSGLVAQTANGGVFAFRLE